MQEKKMGIWKDGKTIEQVAEEVIRSHLIRCHDIISKEYPEIAGMTPVHAADYLLHLKHTGRVAITLYNKSPTEIGCKITERTAKQDSCEQSN